tara:strand:+ start:69 stop:1307 length:1239 start_codon:yes stop_codon:yes gene_type:complete
MKILIVSSYESTGGAAKSALRLHEALLAEKINSNMLVQQKNSDRPKVFPNQGLIQKAHSRIRPALDLSPTRFYKNKDLSLFSPSILPFSGTVAKINQINPDLVHLHWICGGMLKIEDIAKIKVPIVWSLHDNWAFTGGCHIKLECQKYKNSCGSCPRLHSRSDNDLSKKVWKRKMKTFSLMNNLSIVGLSNWLNNCSKESSLLKEKDHFQLPNLIDCNVFKKLDKISARKLWNLPQNKKIILFGAMNINDKLKGFSELIDAIGKISTKNVEAVIFGSYKPVNLLDLKIKTHYIGYLGDDISMATLYSCADLTVVPSWEENLSNVLMESLSCGTPVVGFDIGGNSDLIEHKKTGYLVDPMNINDMSRGIDWILNNNDLNQISNNARQKVLNEFESSVVAKKYVSLYKNILKIN